MWEKPLQSVFLNHNPKPDEYMTLVDLIFVECSDGKCLRYCSHIDSKIIQKCLIINKLLLISTSYNQMYIP
jgi:hypothetical protein